MPRYLRALFAAILVFVAAQSAIAQGNQKFAELGDFRLESGKTIQKCRIGYRTFGELNREKSNAILFPTWFSGRSEDLMGLIGPGKMVDSSKYFVIAVDALGDGVSSSPSNSATQRGRAFPQFTIRDMVNSQHLMLTEKLQIKRLYAVVGISMGGMQTFQWMISYPDFMQKAIPIVGTPRQSSYDLLLWQTELRIIESNRNLKDGKKRAMSVIAGISLLFLYSPHYQVTHTKAADYKHALAEEEKSLARHDLDDYASQLRAMIGHDIFKPFNDSGDHAAAAVRARVLVIVSEQDHMVNPSSSLEFAGLLKAETLELTNDCGHLATVCEGDRLAASIARFLSQ
ncbi:MAG: alpha/beta fold hydrolase [Blastocatellia bacterium]